MKNGDSMWNMASYEVCGRGHFKTNTPCQDKTLVNNKGETYVIALADGAGSAKYSHYGAEKVIEEVSNFLIEDFDGIIEENNGIKVKEKIISIARAGLKIKCEEHECEMRDLASTLLIVGIKKERFFIAHLGDGIIGVVKDGQIKVASKPENGEYTNTTIFITSQNAVNSMKIYKGKTNNIDGFIIMSDGAGESFYHRKTQTLSIGVKKIIDWTISLKKEETENLLKNSFDNIVKNNTQDDCSIAVIGKVVSDKIMYKILSEKEKLLLFKIEVKDIKRANKKLKRYEEIIKEIVCSGVSDLNKVAKKIYIKKKYLKRDIEKLEELGLVENEKNKYLSKIMF